MCWEKLANVEIVVAGLVIFKMKSFLSFQNPVVSEEQSLESSETAFSFAVRDAQAWDHSC